MFKAMNATGRHGRWGLLCISGLLAAVSLGAAEPTAGTVQPPVPSKVALAKAYGRLPLSFEANQGQTDKPVKFLSRGDGFGLYLTAQEAVLALHKPMTGAGKGQMMLRSHLGLSPDLVKGGATPADSGAEEADARSWDLVRMQLAGANRAAMTEGEDRLPGTANYFLGNDPARWHSNIATYAKVRYREVYPGVDLVYYGNQRELEYDFVLAPGASERPIRLRFAGAESVRLDREGNLEIQARNGSVAFHKPEVYQLVGGSRSPVEGRFKLLAGNSVGFTLGHYDHAKPLVIDPILAYSTYLGGESQDYVVALAADSAGATYVTGLTWSLHFPLTAGAFQPVNFASAANLVSTAFVSKFNPSGTALEYSTFIGGEGIADRPHEQGDYGHAITVDAAGEAFVTGYTFSANFPVTSGAFQKGNLAASQAEATGFVTKLNSSGTGLIYSTYLGGSILDEPFGITIDSAGNAYVAGVTFSTNFPVTSGVIQTTNRSGPKTGFNDFITKLNPSGSALVYSTYLGGSSENGTLLGSLYWTNPVVVDQSGNLYVEGFSESSDFPVTAGALQTKPNGGYSVTVSKLNSNASALIYSTYLGGSTFSMSEGLAVDSLGNAYAVGYTDDIDFPVTSGAFQTINKARLNANSINSSQDNGFIAKINPGGTKLVFATYLGGTTGPWGGDEIYGVGLDSADDVYVVGGAMSLDFPVTSDAFQKTNAGATQCCPTATYTSDGFVTELNPGGTGLIYSTYLGGSGRQNANGPGGYGDQALAMKMGSGGAVYVAGYASSGNFPVTAGAYDTAYFSQQNMGFVSKFDFAAAPATKDTETALVSNSTNNTVVPGTAVTFTATVAPVSGAGVPTGSVVFSIDEATVATVALGTTGKASFSTSTLVAGAHYVLASYGGSTTYATSGGGITELVVPVTPVISPPGGTYTSQQNVTISTATPGGVLHYTLDGTVASIFAPTYTTALPVIRSQTVEAVAIAESDASSPVVKNTYTIIGSPSLLSEPAMAIGTSGATLGALVNTLGLAGSYYFQYGTSSAALTASTAKTTLAASTTQAQASAKLTGLAGKTTYYYRVIASTAGGITVGATLSFATN